MMTLDTYSGGRPLWHAIVGSEPDKWNPQYIKHVAACGKRLRGVPAETTDAPTCPRCAAKMSA